MRQQVAEAILKMPMEKLRVVTGDLGGAFGTRVWPYPEYAAVAYAARKLGRPVKWLADRSETFLSDNHGRDHVSEASLAIDREHRFTALRIRSLREHRRRTSRTSARPSRRCPARARRPACTGFRCSTRKCE